MGPLAPNLSSITVTPPSPSVVRTQTQRFIATGVYSNSSTQDLTDVVLWTSSDTAVATIDTTGLATSVGDGTTIIRATYSGVTGNTNLTVTELALVSVSVVPASLSLLVGHTQQYGAIGTYTDSSQVDITADVTWVCVVHGIPGGVRGSGGTR